MGGEQPAVARAAIQLDASARIGMIGTGMSATLKVGRPWDRRKSLALGIGIGQAGLLPVRSRKPAEEMIKGSIFHHHNDDVLNGSVGGIGKRCRFHPWRQE